MKWNRITTIGAIIILIALLVGIRSCGQTYKNLAAKKLKATPSTPDPIPLTPPPVATSTPEPFFSKFAAAVKEIFDELGKPTAPLVDAPAATPAVHGLAPVPPSESPKKEISIPELITYLQDTNGDIAREAAIRLSHRPDSAQKLIEAYMTGSQNFKERILWCLMEMEEPAKEFCHKTLLERERFSLPFIVATKEILVKLDSPPAPAATKTALDDLKKKRREAEYQAVVAKMKTIENALENPYARHYRYPSNRYSYFYPYYNNSYPVVSYVPMSNIMIAHLKQTYAKLEKMKNQYEEGSL